MMGNIGDQTPDKHMGRFKSELPRATQWQEWTRAGPIEQKTARQTYQMTDIPPLRI